MTDTFEHLIDIVIDPDKVTINGVIVPRSAHVPTSQWLDAWEALRRRVHDDLQDVCFDCEYCEYD